MKERGFSKNKGRVGGKREERGMEKKEGKRFRTFLQLRSFLEPIFFYSLLQEEPEGEPRKRMAGGRTEGMDLKGFVSFRF